MSTHDRMALTDPELSARRGADPSLTEATVGIRRTSTDGTVTDVQTGARGLPAIVAHGHMWTLAIVVAGFVAALIAMVMVVRELRPDPAPRDGTIQVAPKGAAGVRCDAVILNDSR